jgi:hypothetical protein
MITRGIGFAPFLHPEEPMCLRDKIIETEEKIAMLEYMVRINDDIEKPDLLQQLKDATYKKHQLSEELLERQLRGIDS